jgi:PAS domain S-box-containing protein
MEQIATVGDSFLPSYNFYLVALSYLMIVFASYTSLQISVCIRETQGSSKKYWIAACGFILGGGVWSMHFIAMLAYILPVQVGYDPWITFLSLVLVVVPACFSFYLANSKTGQISRVSIGGLALGMGIVCMHYSGMAAMRLNAQNHFDLKLVILSVFIAVVVSWVAITLVLWFGQADSKKSPVVKISAAMVMGVAAAGMHYTAMAAVEFYPLANPSPQEIQPNLEPELLAIIISFFTVVVIGMSIIASLAKGKFQDLKTLKKQLEIRVNERTAELQNFNETLKNEISERKRAEDLAARFGRILDHSSNEIYIFNEHNLKFVQVNNGARKNLGYSEEELSELTALDIKPEFTREKFEALIQPLRERKQSQLVFETVHKRKDGSLYPVEVLLQVSTTEELPLFVAIIQDISQRKESENLVKELHRKNELILNSAGEGIYGLDLEGNTTFVNPAASEMLGYSAEELIGKPQHILIHHSRPDGTPYPREECHIYASIEDGLVHTEENEVFWKKNGNSFPVRYVSKPIFEKQKIVGAVVTFQDTTVEKQQNYRKTMQHDLTRTLAEAQSMDEGISKILYTLTDHPTWDLAFFWSLNPQSNVLHCRLGSHSSRIESGTYGAFSQIAFSTTFEKGMGLPGRVWDTAKPAWIKDVTQDTNFPRAPIAKKVGVHGGFGFPVFSEEKLWGVMEVFTLNLSDPDEDLTRLLEDMGSQFGQFMKRIESEMGLAQALLISKAANINVKEAKEEAENANKTKSVFLANMSHEIRTPLNAILGFSQILLEEKGLEDEQRRALQTIDRSGSHLLELINSILDISKIEAGRMESFHCDFDLTDLIHGLIDMFKIQCDKKGLAIVTHGLPTDALLVHGDELKLRQILTNLIGNAVKFTDAGKVTLELNILENNYYQVAVIDTGKGIPRSAQSNIFEAFRQDDEGHKKGGTGLGLAISQKQLQLMDSKLKLESKPGEGSKFSFTLHLPRAQDEVKKPVNNNKKIIGLAKGHSVKALICDDIAENRDVLSKFLSSVGIEILLSESGEQAFEMVTKHSPDILLMDIRMPGMSGVEASKQIIKKFGKDHVKIILHSASVLEDEQETYKKLGCNGFILKPFRKQTVLDSIQEALSIEYEYESSNEEDVKSPSTSNLDFSKYILPKAILSRLKEGADLCNITQLENALAEICQLEGNGKNLEPHLKECVIKYDMEGIANILEQVTYEQ